MTEQSEIVAPLDAYATAKPDEPTFTLQGGDPFAAPLVSLWAQLARIAAIPEGSQRQADEAVFTGIQAARTLRKTVSESEREELLKRATLAEEVSWNMDAYRKRQATDAEPETSGEKLSVDERLDLYDLRNFAAGRLNNAVSELAEIYERLQTAGFEDEDFFNALRSSRVALQGASRRVRVQRGA